MLNCYVCIPDVTVCEDNAIQRNPLVTDVGKINRVLIGNREFMIKKRVAISVVQEKTLEARELVGETAVICAVNGIALAVRRTHTSQQISRY